MSANKTLHQTSAKHTPNLIRATPGPWRAEAITPEAHADPDLHIDDDEVFWILGGPAEEVLALVEERPRRPAEAYANARLIAASPWLREALRSLLAHVEATVQPFPSLTAAIVDARAALADAEGATGGDHV